MSLADDTYAESTTRDGPRPTEGAWGAGRAARKAAAAAERDRAQDFVLSHLPIRTGLSLTDLTESCVRDRGIGWRAATRTIVRELADLGIVIVREGVVYRARAGVAAPVSEPSSAREAAAKSTSPVGTPPGETDQRGGMGHLAPLAPVEDPMVSGPSLHSDAVPERDARAEKAASSPTGLQPGQETSVCVQRFDATAPDGEPAELPDRGDTAAAAHPEADPSSDPRLTGPDQDGALPEGRLTGLPVATEDPALRSSAEIEVVTDGGVETLAVPSGVRGHRSSTPRRDQFVALVEQCPGSSAPELAALAGCSVGSASHTLGDAVGLGLLRRTGRNQATRYWPRRAQTSVTADLLVGLVEARPGLTTRELATEIGISASRIGQVARELGLRNQIERDPNGAGGRGVTLARWYLPQPSPPAPAVESSRPEEPAASPVASQADAEPLIRLPSAGVVDPVEPAYAGPASPVAEEDEPPPDPGVPARTPVGDREGGDLDPVAGVKMDSGKPRWDLLPWRETGQVVGVLTFGLTKYQPDNWQRVSGARARYFAAAQRHLTLWWLGERTDAESGLPHLAHCVCCLLFLMWFDNEGRTP